MPNTSELYETMQFFADALVKWDGEEEQQEALRDLADYKLTPESRAQIIFHFLVTGHHRDGKELNKAGKQFAVVLAETMGPDWAQWLYNFAKIVTKLA